jgi:hypothetical protein
MLRNIPNKVNQVSHLAAVQLYVCSPPQAMLKMILDKTSRGRYDFMYLRIGKSLYPASTCPKLIRPTDFANNCKYVVVFFLFEVIPDIYSVGYAFINFNEVSPPDFTCSVDYANIP